MTRNANSLNCEKWVLINTILNGVRKEAGKPLVPAKNNPYRS